MSTLSDIVRLLTDPLTCALAERHACVVERFAASRGANGILVSELGALQQVLILLGERVSSECSANGDTRGNDTSPLACALVSLLRVCERPFVEEKANAKYRHCDQICSLLVATSSLLLNRCNAVRIAAAHVLYDFTKKKQASSSSSKANVLAQRPDEWTYNHHLFQRSGAMSVVADAVRQEVAHLFINDLDEDGRIDQVEYDNAYGIVPGDNDRTGDIFTVHLMKLVCELAAYEDNALSLNREQVPPLLVKVVAQLVDFRKEEVKLMLQTLWSVLEHSSTRVSNVSQRASTRVELLDKYRNANALYGLGNTETLGMLRSLLERMLVEGFKRPDKELRNEVLIISSLLARRAANLEHFESTGFLSLLVLYAGAAENELPTGCDDRHFVTNDPLDKEFKVLVWYLVKTLATNQANRDVVGDSPFLQSLLFYVRPETAQHPSRVMWSPNQLKSLQLNALTVLAYMTKLLPQQFVQLGGPAALVHFLSTLHAENDKHSAGNESSKAVLADGPASNPVNARVDATLQVILGMDTSKEALGSQERKLLVRLVLAFLQFPVVHIRSTSSLVLARLCDGNSDALKEFRRRKGVAKIAQFLLVDSTNFLYTDSGLVSCLAVVHNAVATCQKSLLAFLALDGIELLLNALESVEHDEVRGQLLAVLADLLHASKGHALPYVLEWKSYSTGRAAPSVALDLWLDNYAPDAIKDQDLIRPIGRRRMPPMTGENDNIDQGNKARKTCGRLQHALRVAKASTIPDLDQRVLRGAQHIDIRDRVAAFLQALGFDNVNTALLSRDQRIAFGVVLNYKDFCQGEEWVALKADLKEQGIKPIFYDSAFLEDRIRVFRELAKETQQLQSSEEKAKLEDEINQDSQFFNAIIEKRDQEIQANIVKKQVSVMKKRLEQKEKQKEMLRRAAETQQVAN